MEGVFTSAQADISRLAVQGISRTHSVLYHVGFAVYITAAHKAPPYIPNVCVGRHITPCRARHITRNKVVHITNAQHSYHEHTVFYITSALPSISRRHTRRRPTSLTSVPADTQAPFHPFFLHTFAYPLAQFCIPLGVFGAFRPVFMHSFAYLTRFSRTVLRTSRFLGKNCALGMQKLRLRHVKTAFKPRKNCGHK